MKFLKNICLAALLGVAAVVSTLPAMAQNGLDYFYTPRTVFLIYPTNLTTSGSNFVIDTSGYIGTAKIDFIGIVPPNGSTNVMSVTLASSPDWTNWTSVSNYALAVSNNIIYTNTVYAANLFATNFINLPGTITTPTASSAGFATAYLNPALETNAAGPITITPTAANAGAAVTIGVDMGSLSGRYLRAAVTVGGTTTNGISATFTCRKNQTQ
jgi:hypothetical protein